MAPRSVIRFGLAVGALAAGGALAVVAGAPSGATTTVPGAPTGLTVTLGRAVGEVRLAWTAPVDTGGGIASYALARATVSGGVTGTWSAPVALPTTTTRATTSCTATFPDVCAYRVVALNPAGTSTPSSAATVVWAVPSAATRLRAVPASVRDFGANDLSWNAPVRTGGLAVSYDVQIRVDSGAWTDIAQGITARTIADDAHCTGSTSCVYRVLTHNAVGFGPSSNSSALVVRPTAVTTLGVSVSAVDPSMGNPTSGASTVAVTWGAPRAGLADGPYEVAGCLDVCDATHGTWTTPVQVANTATSASVPCAAEYRTCSYRVRATNTRGGIGPWGYRTVSPFAPVIVSVATGGVVDGVDVTFQGVAETGTGSIVDKHFEIWTCGSSCADAANWSTDPGDDLPLGAVTAFPVTRPVVCTGASTCQVRVRFVDGSGNEGPLSIAAGAPVGALPDAPTGLTVTTGTIADHVAATWTAPADAGTPALTGYQTRISYDGTNWSGWTATGSTATSANVDCAGGGYACFVEVRAVNAIGAGAPSDPDDAIAATAPGQLAGLAATASSTAGWIDLTWETANFYAGHPGYTDVEYRVRVNSGSYGAWTSTGTTSGAFTDTACGSGNTCTYQVRAVSALGAGAASSEASDTAG